MVTLTRHFNGPERLARVIVIVGLLVANAQVSADTLSVPNNFASGTAARAADVNKNFESVHCSATAYHHEPAGFLSRLYDLSDAATWYSFDHESVAVADVTIYSASSPEGGVPLDFGLDFEFVKPGTLNDPAVTGVIELPCIVPIKFQRP